MRQHAAVDSHDLPVDEGSIVGEQERHQRGHVLGVAGARQKLVPAQTPRAFGQLGEETARS